MLKKLVYTGNMERDEWLSWRRKGIGGSDVGAIMGLNPYSSPFDVWAQKTGRAADRADNEAMRQGRDFEAYVASRFCEATGKSVRQSHWMYRHPERPYMLANIDRLVVGEKSGLECKTTSVYNEKMYKGGDVPYSYYCQCMHYLAVTGLERWYLAVLVLNKGFYWFTIERDEEQIDQITEMEKSFWTYVEADIPPAADGSTATSAILSEMWRGKADQTEVLLSSDDEAPLSRWEAIQEEISQLEDEKRMIENQLKTVLKDAPAGVGVRWKISWKPQTSNRVDTAKLKQQYPDVYDKCVKVSESRPLRIRRMEEDA